MLGMTAATPCALLIQRIQKLFEIIRMLSPSLAPADNCAALIRFPKLNKSKEYVHIWFLTVWHPLTVMVVGIHISATKLKNNPN